METADFERIAQFIDDHMHGWVSTCMMYLITYTDFNTNAQHKGRKPTHSKWARLTLQILNQAADDAKAWLIVVGYMKGAEDCKLIILQAWDCACKWCNVPYPFPKITPRQILYVCFYIQVYHCFVTDTFLDSKSFSLMSEAHEGSTYGLGCL
jgi:hypothetical protein